MRIAVAAGVCLGMGAFAAGQTEAPKAVNSLVTKLLHVRSPAAAAESTHDFTNPRAG